MLALPVLAKTFKYRTINPFQSVETSARGIDNDGEVVGDFADATLQTADAELGFLRRGDYYKKIKVTGARDTDANGINNDDDIVGTYDDNLGDHGYVLDGKKVHKLPDPPAGFDNYPDFNAINEDGEVVGVVTPRVFGLLSVGTGNKGFVLSEGKYTILDCGYYQTEANGINDDDDIVGECSDSSYVEHAFLLHEGKYHIFDVPFPNTIGTVALGINNEGDIVGVYTDANFNDHGFIVHDLCKNAKWKTIDVPGASDTKVAAINDEGDIAGTYTKLGVNKGFKAEKEAY
jgi:uncharacterized membrane protein